MIEIEHVIRYNYSSGVFLQPQTIRLRPRSDFIQQVVSSHTAVSPDPAGIRESLDIEGNLIHLAWFNETTDFLEVKNVSKILFHDYNPFSFLIHPAEATNLPLKYSDEYSIFLPNYLNHQASLEMKSYADELMNQCDNDSIRFLMELSLRINAEYKYEYREYGSPRNSKETFDLKSGACRDLTVLFMDICRYTGIASRFVSGYYLPEKNADKPEFHAWAEVFIPGAGWIGFDPTHGIAAYGRHVALSSSSNPEFTLPVSGSFNGEGESILQTSLKISVLNYD